MARSRTCPAVNPVAASRRATTARSSTPWSISASVSAPSRRSISRSCARMDNWRAATVAMCCTTETPAGAAPGVSMARDVAGRAARPGDRQHVPAGDGAGWCWCPGSGRRGPAAAPARRRAAGSAAACRRTACTRTAARAGRRSPGRSGSRRPATAPRRDRCSWASSRWAVSPCTAAATSWAMAMNGTGIGTSTTGNDRSSAAARKSRVSGGTNRPSDRARQATPASSSRSR